MAYTSLTNAVGAVGQRWKASIWNLAIQAIQELQSGIMDLRPQLRMYAPASVTNGSVVPYASLRRDSHGGWSGSPNYRYTVPIAGLYLIEVAYKAGVSAVSPAQQIQINSVGEFFSPALPSQAYVGGHLTAVVDLAAGDLVRVVENNATYTPQNDTPGSKGTGSNYLHITYLGPTT